MKLSWILLPKFQRGEETKKEAGIEGRKETTLNIRNFFFTNNHIYCAKQTNKFSKQSKYGIYTDNCTDFVFFCLTQSDEKTHFFIFYPSPTKVAGPLKHCRICGRSKEKPSENRDPGPFSYPKSTQAVDFFSLYLSRAPFLQRSL